MKRNGVKGECTKHVDSATVLAGARGGRALRFTSLQCAGMSDVELLPVHAGSDFVSLYLDQEQTWQVDINAANRACVYMCACKIA